MAGKSRIDAVRARNRAALRQAALRTSQWGLGIIAVLATGFALWGGALINLMAKAPEVQAEAQAYLIYMVLAPILGLAAWMLDGIFIGATRTRDMRNMMAVSLMIYVVAVIVLMPLIGNHGLWAALLISYVARGLTLGLRYPALERAVASQRSANASVVGPER